MNRLDNLRYPIVQLSLDLTSLDEALETAAIAVEAGVDWLEAGTPLLLADGLHAVEGLRKRFPDHPIVADLKTMDGGYLEAEMMAKAGADLVVVMGRAHEATIRRVVDAARDFGIKVMGDNLAADDRVANAKWMESLGVDFIVHHIGFDERGLIKGLSPLDELDDVVRAVSIPVQAVGGLSIEQAHRVRPARRAAGRRRRSARHRRRRIQARRSRTVPGPAAHLLGDQEGQRAGLAVRAPAFALELRRTSGTRWH